MGLVPFPIEVTYMALPHLKVLSFVSMRDSILVLERKSVNLNIGINRLRKMFPKIKQKSTEKIIPKRDLMEGLLDFVLFFFNSAVHWKS